MVEIGDTAKRVMMAEYGIDIGINKDNGCCLEFYREKACDEANEIRSKLVNELKKNIPDALKIRT